MDLEATGYNYNVLAMCLHVHLENCGERQIIVQDFLRACSYDNATCMGALLSCMQLTS